MNNKKYWALVVLGVMLTTIHFSATLMVLLLVNQTPRLDRIDRTIREIRDDVDGLKKGPNSVQLQEQTVQVVIDYLKSTGRPLESHSPEELRKARDSLKADLDRLIKEKR